MKKTAAESALISEKNDSKEQKRLQMADIARLAGVSTSTVSRALAGSPLVNEETRLRVAELAKSLNYTINVGAQNLRLKQSKTIAVVVPYDSQKRQHLSDPFFLSMLGSLADALTDRGFEMLLSRVDAENLTSVASIYDTGSASGIILIGQWRHHDQLNQLAARKVPLVVWGAQLPQQLYITVGSDNVSGGYLATTHLIKRGRKRIAFFGDIRLPEVAHRYQGYLNAHEAAGLEADPQLLVNAAFTEEGGSEAVHTLIGRHADADGIFACSDLLAMTAINTLRQLQIQVPRQISVVGFDDIDQARYFHPALSTIRQSIAEAGVAIVSTLLEYLQHGSAAPRLLRTALQIRESS